MTEEINVSLSPMVPDNLQTGMIKTARDPRNLVFSSYFKAGANVVTLPDPPDSVYWGSNSANVLAPNTTINWGMMKNDTQGDCVVAAAGHLMLLENVFALNGPIRPTDDEILDIYCQACGWNRVGPGNGCSPNAVVNYWRNHGFPVGFEPEIYRGKMMDMVKFKNGEQVWTANTANAAGPVSISYVRSFSSQNCIYCGDIQAQLGTDVFYANASGNLFQTPNRDPLLVALPTGTVITGSNTGARFVVGSVASPAQPIVHKITAYMDTMFHQPPIQESVTFANTALAWTPQQIADETAKRNRVLKLGTQLFGGVMVSIGLPKQLVPAGYTWATGIWSLINPTLSGNFAPYSGGGHEVLIIGYDANVIYFVTWGKVARMSWDFFNTYVDGGFVIVGPDWIINATQLSASGFDMPTLLNDVANITSE